MKTGLVLEGGAVRGIFTAGILDRLMESDIYFPYVIGVSAGGGNAMGYCSHQRGRTVRQINVSKSDSYYGFKQMIESGKFIDLDKMCYEYPYLQFPFDFETYFSSGIETEYVCTCCETGEAAYLSEYGDEKRLLDCCKATCSVPLLCDMVEIDGMHYLDGSIADSIPIIRAFERGCDKAVVIMTKPEGSPPTDYRKLRTLLNKFYRDYPAFVDSCMTRIDRYEQTVSVMEELQSEGRVYIIRPEIEPISKFERDTIKRFNFYRHGYNLMSVKLMELADWAGEVSISRR